MGLLAGRQRVAGLGVFELAERDRFACLSGPRFSLFWPTSLNVPETRPASRSGELSVTPSPI